MLHVVLGLAVLAGGGKIKFQEGKDYEKAMAEAKASGTPVMIYFTAEWCGPCKALSAGAFSDEEVVKASEKLVRIMVDADKDGAVFKKHGVNSMPQMLFLDPDGKEVAKMTKRDAASLKKQIEEVATAHKRDPK